MSRLNDFIVNISLETIPEREMPFGNMAIVTDEKDQAFQVYTHLEDVVDDFAITTDTYKMASQLFSQVPEPSQIAVVGKNEATALELTGLLTENINEDFTVFFCTNNADAYIAALDVWAGANQKIYAVTTQNLALFSTIIGRNTFMQYHSVAGTYFAECLTVYMMLRPIGSCTAKFKNLAGVPESDITAAQLLALHEANGGTYITDMGVRQSTNSKVQSGEHFDVVLTAMWIKLEMEKGLRNLALTNDKIPYNNSGVAMLVSVAEFVLKRAAENGAISVDESGNPIYTITYKPVNQLSYAERASRKYNFISWVAKLSGAIQGGTIGGKLEI